MAITITKENTVTKIKAATKESITEFIMNVLANQFGEDAVAMVRTGNASKTNEIGVIVDTCEGEDGSTNPIVVTINPTVKEFANRKTDKRTYEAFDFIAAKTDYENYIVEKAEKAEAAASAKEAKKARDEAARKAKAED